MSVTVIEDPALLAEAYRTLLAPSFDETELVSLDQLRAGIDDGSAEVLAIVEEGRPIAVAIGDFSPGVVLLSYLAVSVEHRSRRLGTVVLDEAIRVWAAREGGPVLIVAEVEDPAVHGAHPTRGDPARRLRFYARHGARLLDVDYFQPSLGAGLPRVPGVLLLVLHAGEGLLRDGRLIDAGPVVAMLEDYFGWSEGSPRPGDDDAVALFAALEAPGGPAVRPLAPR